MSNARVTTKTGDFGTTELFNKKRISKAHPIIELIGSTDEAQAVLALVKTQLPAVYKNELTNAQQNLYIMMGEFSGASIVSGKEVNMWVDGLETAQHKLMKKTSIANRFVIPGNMPEEAWCQYARTVVRRFERLLVRESVKKTTYRKYIPYVNRLSDYLFVLGNIFTTLNS